MSQIRSESPALEVLFGQAVGKEQPREALPLDKEVTSFFDEFHDQLLRYLLSFRLEVHDAEDIIQEVFLALFRHLGAAKPRSNIKGWIFRVAHNLGLKRQYAKRRDEPITESQVDPGSDPEEELMNVQRRRRLLAVVAALRERDRRCLILRAEGLRYREIAEVLDVSLGTVSASLERSIKRLTEVERR